MSDEKIQAVEEEELSPPSPGETQIESFAETIAPLIPLAKDVLENHKTGLDHRHRLNEMQLEFARDRLQMSRDTSRRAFWLLTLITIGIFAISAGIVFYLEEATLGLQVLSHVGAVIAGAIAGAGWTRARHRQPHPG